MLTTVDDLVPEEGTVFWRHSRVAVGFAFFKSSHSGGSVSGGSARRCNGNRLSLGSGCSDSVLLLKSVRGWWQS